MALNTELAARREAAVPRGLGSSTAVYADRAEGAELWDVEGRRYIDLATGIAVVNVGHRHPRIIKAVQEQLTRFSHTAFQVAPYESYVRLAERLNAMAPFSGAAKSLFFATGAEATENAVKVARAATGRPAVIAFAGGFHGRTLFASAMTGKVAPYKRPFGMMPGGVYHVPFPTQGGATVTESLRAIDTLFAADLDPSSVAAIIIEPVQGEGGFHVAPQALLEGLRALCDTHGILLIADEIQTGFARTGRTFAIEHSGVEPDLVTVAKALGGGFPISGLIGRAQVMDAVDPGGLGGTYGGSPIGCAAALAVLDVLESERLCERAETVGQILRARLAAFAARDDLAPIGPARGLGAMIGFDVLASREGAACDPARVKAICAKALEHGVIILSCGANGEAIRLLPPLTIDEATLEEGLAGLEAALRDIVAA